MSTPSAPIRALIAFFTYGCTGILPRFMRVRESGPALPERYSDDPLPADSVPVQHDANDTMSLDPDTLIALDLNAVVRSIDGLDESEYDDRFATLAKEAGERRDERARLAWNLLRKLTSLNLRPENEHEPFQPLVMTFEGSGQSVRRSSVLEDIDDSELDALVTWLPEAEDVALRARVADILWLRRRDHTHAAIAVHAYLDAAELLENGEHWISAANRVKRALRLAALFRKSGQEPELYQRALAAARARAERFDTEGELAFAIHMIEAISTIGNKEPAPLLELAQRIARQAREWRMYTRAESAFAAAERLATQAKDTTARQAVNTEWAEMHADSARMAERGIIATKFMEKAIERYRRVPGSKSQQVALYDELRVLQQQALDEMGVIRGPEIDLTADIARAESLVSGKSWPDALVHFALGVSSGVTWEEIEQHVRASANEFSVRRLFDTDYLDRDGLHVGTQPAWLEADEKMDARAIWSEMLPLGSFRHREIVHGQIEPARRRLLLEHRVTEDRLLELVRDNPFVPGEMARSVAKGLYAGFVDDFITSGHILPPRLEGCLRYVLEQRGVETTSLNTQGVQERMRMKAILAHSTTKEIFGKNVVGDLTAILIEPRYTNLKNAVSHAFIGDDEFDVASVMYLWWLVLRLCMVPIVRIEESASES